LLKLKIEQLVKFGPRDRVIAFLKNLILNDKADGSNMPNIFRGKLLDEVWQSTDLSGDVVQNKYEIEKQNSIILRII